MLWLDFAFDLLYFGLGPLLSLYTTKLDIRHGIEVLGPNQLLRQISFLSVHWWLDVLTCCVPCVFLAHVAPSVHVCRWWLLGKAVRAWRIAANPKVRFQLFVEGFRRLDDILTICLLRRKKSTALILEKLISKFFSNF